MKYTASKVIELARQEEGYLEKRTASNLDDKTANAGSGNYTKYARDIDAIPNLLNGKKQGISWCAVFVLWLFVTLWGAAQAMKMLCLTAKSLAASCTYWMNYYKAAGRFFKDPKPGDQIFFGKGNTAEHTGIVEKIENGRVYTIEGNTSAKSGVVSNGGGVFPKSYPLNDKNILGYGRPLWDDEEVDAEEPNCEEFQFKVGDIVNFTGTNHYVSANAPTGHKVKAGKVKITAIHKSGKHQYHCHAVNDAGKLVGGVYGWVDAADLTAITDMFDKPVVPTTIKKGDVVSIDKNATYYSGKDVPDWVIAKQWIVASAPVGDRVILGKSVDGENSISSPIHAMFLTVADADKPWTPKVGEIVNYNGAKHYANANATIGSSCKGGLAKITNIYQLGKSKHPYHLVRISGKGASVYGWVDEGSFTKA